MKYFLLLGGFAGFLIVFVSGLAAGNEISHVLRNATIGCLCGALLLRGFRLLLQHQVRQVAAAESETLGTSQAAVPAHH